MIRNITTHKGDHVNDRITVEAAREPGPGGAHNLYSLAWPLEVPYLQKDFLDIAFHHGPGEKLVGITNEALLAVLIDRVRGFQQGPFACDENDEAVHHLHEALRVFQERTRSRQDRGVLGKQET